ncbi:MAG: N-acetylmuramoyl-L-alanine amidase [Bryobacteraceae bacterium]
MRAADFLFELRRSKLGAAMLVAAMALLGAQAATAADTARVTEVRFWSLGEMTRISIEVSSDFTFKSDRLTNPERVFFDIHGATPSMVRKGMQTIAVGDSLVQQIRVAEVTTGVTRVVMDLAQPVASSASHLSNPDRLIVELHSKDKPAPPQTPSVTGSTKLVQPAPTPEEQAATTPGPAKAAAAEVKESKESKDTKEAKDLKAERTASAEPRTKKGKRSAKLDASHPREAASMPEPVRNEPSRVEIVPALKTPEPAAREAAPVRVAMEAPAIPSAPVAPPALSYRLETVEVAPVPAESVANESPARPEPAPREAIAKVSPPKSLPEPPKDIGPVREAVPAKRGDRDLTRALGLKIGRVVLDAGHGGHDVGTHGASGLLEKDLTLDVVRRLGALIEERLGSEVVYTRRDDSYVGLEDRTRIANERKADLFLSIHANSSPYRSAAGVETYVLNFTTSKSAMELASRENATAESSVFSLQDLVNKIALKEKIDESREFAARLQSALSVLSTNSNDSAKNRGVKKAPFIVLIGATMPSVLAEVGFLTNTNDEALLRKPEHRQKIAEALYKGIAAYASSLSRFQVAKN